MQPKNIVILLGHPDSVGVCIDIANTYEEAARAAGHHVERFNIGEMHFDPILHEGYRTIQELEPDLVHFQEVVRACDHLVIVYPNWWSGPPALLKGLFDSVWLPGFAYRYIKAKDGTRTMFWNRLLKGKTARVIVTTGMHPLALRLLYGHYMQQISIGTLWFAGFHVHESSFGPAEDSNKEKESAWLKRVRAWGKRGA